MSLGDRFINRARLLGDSETIKSLFNLYKYVGIYLTYVVTYIPTVCFKRHYKMG